jgi:putative transposase
MELWEDMYRLDSSGNAVFSLQYHLIVCTKYRRKVFCIDTIINEVKQIVEEQSEKFEVQVIAQEVGLDHIHILFRCKPTLNIPKYLNALKGVSSRLLRKKFDGHLKPYHLGEHFWSPSYFLTTAGNVTIDKLIGYVEGQRSKITDEDLEEAKNAESVQV